MNPPEYGSWASVMRSDWLFPTRGFVGISWESVRDTGAFRNSTVFYSVFAGIQFYERQVGITTLTSFNVSVPIGSKWSFKVRASNFRGDFTSFSSYLTATSCSRPSAPQSLFSGMSSNYSTVTWTVPSDLGGTYLIGFGICNSHFRSCKVLEPYVFAHSFGAIDTRAPSNFTAWAINDCGVSAINATFLAAWPPEAPLNLTVVGLAANKAVFKWAYPDADGGSPVTGYNLYVSNTAGGSFSKLWYGNSLETALTLPTSQRFFFHVSAINSFGESSMRSNVASIETFVSPSAPGQPLVSDSDCGSQSLSLVWTPPRDNGGCPISEYSIFLDNQAVFNISGMSPSFRFDPSNFPIACDGSTRVFKISAKNCDHWSEPSPGLVSQNSGAPSIVTGLTASVFNDSSLVYSWDPLSQTPSGVGSDSLSTFQGYQLFIDDGISGEFSLAFTGLGDPLSNRAVIGPIHWTYISSSSGWSEYGFTIIN